MLVYQRVNLPTHGKPRMCGHGRGSVLFHHCRDAWCQGTGYLFSSVTWRRFFWWFFFKLSWFSLGLKQESLLLMVSEILQTHQLRLVCSWNPIILRLRCSSTIPGSCFQDFFSASISGTSRILQAGFLLWGWVSLRIGTSNSLEDHPRTNGYVVNNHDDRFRPLNGVMGPLINGRTSWLVNRAY